MDSHEFEINAIRDQLQGSIYPPLAIKEQVANLVGRGVTTSKLAIRFRISSKIIKGWINDVDQHRP